MGKYPQKFVPAMAKIGSRRGLIVPDMILEKGSILQMPDFAITVDSAARPGSMDHFRDAWQQREAIVRPYIRSAMIECDKKRGQVAGQRYAVTFVLYMDFRIGEAEVFRPARQVVVLAGMGAIRILPTEIQELVFADAA